MKTKLLLSAVTALLAGVSAASAADLAARPYTKAPVVAPAPIYSWAGFYIGIEGGGGWARDGWTLPTAAGLTAASTDLSGGLVGGVIGYNWQLPNNLVLGVEGNLNWADISGNSTCISNPALSCHSKLDSLFTATGRLGYAAGPALLYVKGGGAWTRDRYEVDTIATGAFLESATANRSGWTVGAGVGYMFAPNWSAKVEYDYYDFGTNRSGLVTAAGTVLDTIDSKLTLHTVKAGIDYHFNWGGPVVAKY